ncbi:ThuA domain-containing protein [Erysipelothrix aquatica]|uniref:ThuA domain-containing protein n=1 Tax=Erysipelothrix aquatica TaxID=2683714 RepID=UPI00135CADAE|nr:ThuA domain-containing protein [Erysipelothrix aquatica]
MNITIYNEFIHEQTHDAVKAVYPEGIHTVLAEMLRHENDTISVVTLENHDTDASREILKNTDVLLWWGHLAHDKVSDDIVTMLKNQVLNGMGLVVLHSGHMSKLFMRLMGTSCDLKWREAGEKERLWVLDPIHPIMRGIPEYIELENEEMYGEFFDIPKPDDVLMVSWFTGGEVFRSACTFTRGHGKIFYFRPGHETYPTYYDPHIQSIIRNGVKWVTPTPKIHRAFGNRQALEVI